MMGHLFGQFYTSRLPAAFALRSNVRIAHKTGDFWQRELTIGRSAELRVNRWCRE